MNKHNRIRHQIPQRSPQPSWVYRSPFSPLLRLLLLLLRLTILRRLLHFLLLFHRFIIIIVIIIIIKPAIQVLLAHLHRYTSFLIASPTFPMLVVMAVMASSASLRASARLRSLVRQLQPPRSRRQRSLRRALLLLDV